MALLPPCSSALRLNILRFKWYHHCGNVPPLHLLQWPTYYNMGRRLIEISNGLKMYDEEGY